MPQPIVGVLAVQGAFIEHERRLESLGARCVELRQVSDLKRPFDRLVLPGGESTAQAKMLHELGMFDTLHRYIAEGMPVLATCAGLILLAEHLEGDSTVHFGTLPATVRRNAYGRQLGSFHAEGTLLDPVENPAMHTPSPAMDAAPSYAQQAKVILQTRGSSPLPMTFIRAPRIIHLHGSALPLATLPDTTIAATLAGNQLACAFHPELDSDPCIHQLFLTL